MAGKRWTPVTTRVLKANRTVRGLIVLRLFLDPINDGRSERREVLIRGSVATQRYGHIPNVFEVKVAGLAEFRVRVDQ